jgi:hypothetical protein
MEEGMKDKIQPTGHQKIGDKPENPVIPGNGVLILLGPIEPEHGSKLKDREPQHTQPQAQEKVHHGTPLFLRSLRRKFLDIGPVEGLSLFQKKDLIETRGRFLPPVIFPIPLGPLPMVRDDLSIEQPPDEDPLDVVDL